MQSKYIVFLQNLKTLSNMEQILLYEAGQIRRGCYLWVTRRNMSISHWRSLCSKMKEFGFVYRGHGSVFGWYKKIGYITRDELKGR